MADPFSPEDLQALHFAQAHLQAAGDPRAEKLGAFLRANTLSNLKPTTQLEQNASKVGSMVPDWAVSPLQFLEHRVIEPTETMGRIGGEMGRSAPDVALGPSVSDIFYKTKGAAATGLPYTPPSAEEMAAPGEEAARKHPLAMGTARAVGGAVGSTVGDPKNWPLMSGSFARPILRRLAATGFAGMMGKAEIDKYKDLHNNWDAKSPAERYEAGADLGITGLMTAAAAHGALQPEGVPVHEAESAKPNPTEQVATRPEAPATPAPGSEYQRMKARLAELEQQPIKGSQANETKPVGQQEPSPATATPQEPVQAAAAAEESREPVPPAEKPQVAGTAEGAKADTDFFKQAKQELGPDTSVSKLLLRAQELKEQAKPRSVADIYAASEMPEAERTPEQKAADREAFLNMTKKYSGANALGPRELEAQRGSLSLRPLEKTEDPLAEIKAKGSMMDRLSTAVHDMFVTSPEKQGAMNIIRTRTAEYAQHVQQASAAFDSFVKAHDSDGDAELRTFMDAGEGKPGAEFARPADMAAAQLLKEEFQDRWQKLSKLPGREEQGAGIENYLKHLFIGPKGQDLASRIMFGKRPLKGPATFTKHRFYEYMSDGLDNGLVPATYNPVRMQLLGLFEIDRYLMAHGMKNDMKAAGLIQFFKMGQDRPEGWQKINDEIFQPRVKVKGGRVEYGNYYAPKDAAKIFNNYLSPGLRGNLAYDIVRNYGNFLNQIQLGFSGFHAVGSSINAMINDVGLGLMRLSKGQVGGIADIIKAPLSARTNYKLGKMIEEEYVNPGSHPELERLARSLKEGGGRIGLDPMWENRAVESFRRTLHSLNKPTDILKLGFHGIEAMAEKFSAPLMKYYVPRLKIGAFAKLAEFKLGELTKEGATREQIQTELGKIWDSIDNRMGQFTYDNLFWQRTAKDLAFLSVRSFGWTFGSLREAGGATADTFRQLQRMKEGQSPELTARMAYTIALPIVVGTLGTIMGTLMGHPPQNLEDRFFPQGGGVDASGKPSRWSFPSYMRDVYSFKRAPAETLVHKMHPALAQLAELYQNHDFYNTEIRDPYAPLWKQAVQVGEYMAKGYIPFGVRNTMQRRNEGESWKSAIGGEVGFTPAPRYIGQTKAEEIASDLAQRHMEKGPFPQGTQEKRQEFYRVRNQFHAGKLNSGDLLNLVKSGKLSPKQAGHIVSEKGQPPLIRHFNTQGMSWDERFKIWDAATPTEKTELKPYLLKHVKSAQSEPPDVRDAIYKRLREIFVPHQ